MQDSRADDEYEECRLKARFLTGLEPGFELFETVLATAAVTDLRTMLIPKRVVWVGLGVGAATIAAVAKVERLEYDPNRTAHIALLCYADGERRYIIASSTSWN